MADITNKLLTALLIAGLSVMAKAEPVVYYCNTIKFVEVFKDEVINIKSYPFKLFVDLKSKKIKIAGEIGDFEATGDEVITWSPFFKRGENAFYGGNALGTFDFQHNTLIYSKATARDSDKELFIMSFIARCDKF